MHYTVECYSNGVLTYSKLIKKLAVNCKEVEANIHKIVSKYVENFEDFNIKYIGGIEHIKDNDFDYTKYKVSAINHPLGTVYQKGWFGYVANGYDWYKFPILKLGKIISNFNK